MGEWSVKNEPTASGAHTLDRLARIQCQRCAAPRGATLRNIRSAALQNEANEGVADSSFEQAELRLRPGQLGVEAARLEDLGELAVAVVGVDLLWLHPLNQLHQLVEVGVIG